MTGSFYNFKAKSVRKIGNQPLFGFDAVFALQGIFFRIFEAVEFEIHIKIGPIKVKPVQQTDILNLRKGFFMKPWVGLIVKKVFLSPYENPDAFRGYIFNVGRNGFAISRRPTPCIWAF